MGRYDGEDYSDEYYAERARDAAAARAEGYLYVLVQLAPKNWKYIARLRELGRGSYGEFGQQEAYKALGRIKDKKRLLLEWEKYGLIWPRSKPIFRTELDFCLQLSPTGKNLAEVFSD